MTAAAEGGPAGLAVGSFFSVSLDPPLVAFCAAETSSSYPKIRAAEHFAVNILGDDQEDVCRTFAGKGDKFAGLGWRPAAVSGAPVLHGVLAWIDCDLEAEHPAGDHCIVIGRVHEMEVGDEAGGPLVFYRGGYGRFEP